jgi:hypothetical protein
MPTSPSHLAFKCPQNKLGGGRYVPSPLLYIPMPLKKMRGVGTYLSPFHVHALIKNWKGLGMCLPPILHSNAFYKKWEEENMCISPFCIPMLSKKLRGVGMCLPRASKSLFLKLILEEIGKWLPPPQKRNCIPIPFINLKRDRHLPILVVCPCSL